MRDPIKTLFMSLAAVSVLGCSACFAQSLKYQTVKPTYTQQKPDGTSAAPRDPQSGLPTGQRMHKPYVLGPASPTTSRTQNKPIDPALQGNVLQKSGGNSPSLYQKLNTGVHYNNATINVR
jgi:hypothetical protein